MSAPAASTPRDPAQTASLVAIVILVAAGAAWRLRAPPAAAPPAAAAACEHGLARGECPSCAPGPLESKGWCGAHGVPEAACTRCTPGLIPAFEARGDWCAEHGLPESQCVACRPDLARTSPPAGATAGAAWCAEHGLPEADCFLCSPDLVGRLGACAPHGVPLALCTRCRPGLVPAFQAAKDWCAEHGLPESQCVACDPARAAPPPPALPPGPGVVNRLRAAPSTRCTMHLRRLRLPADVARQVGLEVVPVERRLFRDALACNAETAFAADRHARLASRVAGVVRDVRVDLGQRVVEGDVVATVDSPELGEARADHAEARALSELWTRNHAREEELAERGVGTRRQVLDADTRRVEARARLARAEQRLRSLGLSTDGADEVLSIRAPFAGVVVSRLAARGEVVSAGQPLLAIADTRAWWALLDVREGDLARVRLGQPVVVRVDALRGESFAGRITWIASEVDRRTRTVKARAELDDPAGLLRANLFGAAVVTLADRPDALVVPREAVQWEGCCNVVFVRAADGPGAVAFEPRKVRLGGTTERAIEVLAGLAGDEQVVTTGSFILKTELLKGSIGAGCCEGE